MPEIKELEEIIESLKNEMVAMQERYEKDYHLLNDRIDKLEKDRQCQK